MGSYVNRTAHFAVVMLAVGCACTGNHLADRRLRMALEGGAGRLSSASYPRRYGQAPPLHPPRCTDVEDEPECHRAHRTPIAMLHACATADHALATLVGRCDDASALLHGGATAVRALSALLAGSCNDTSALLQGGATTDRASPLAPGGSTTGSQPKWASAATFSVLRCAAYAEEAWRGCLSVAPGV